MFENTSLQEAYTGALIGDKGKSLNNISLIKERVRTKHEDWVRVRFGPGTPWRRCWCVITPPDEKEYQKLQKEFNKKKSAYDRSKPPVIRGDIKFYDTKKTKMKKKAQLIAQITNAYSAFAIYPQSETLIDASTLVKLEGIITVYSNPPCSKEGIVFVMQEVHPVVKGCEMMLRWLFPVWDTFALYGRPSRLLADTENPSSLLFAMPTESHYSYLDILDVSSLILTEGSQNWTKMEWRRNLKDQTTKRMMLRRH
jgi:CCR4-NOT transcriptional complex subunit CAF120